MFRAPVEPLVSEGSPACDILLSLVGSEMCIRDRDRSAEATGQLSSYSRFHQSDRDDDKDRRYYPDNEQVCRRPAALF